MPTNANVQTRHELDGYVTTTRAAELLGDHLATRVAVVKMIDADKLRAIWIGGIYLVEKASIEEYLAGYVEKRGRPRKSSA